MLQCPYRGVVYFNRLNLPYLLTHLPYDIQLITESIFRPFTTITREFKSLHSNTFNNEYWSKAQHKIIWYISVVQDSQKSVLAPTHIFEVFSSEAKWCVYTYTIHVKREKLCEAKKGLRTYADSDALGHPAHPRSHI